MFVRTGQVAQDVEDAPDHQGRYDDEQDRECTQGDRNHFAALQEVPARPRADQPVGGRADATFSMSIPSLLGRLMTPRRRKAKHKDLIGIGLPTAYERHC